MIKGQAGGRS